MDRPFNQTNQFNQDEVDVFYEKFTVNLRPFMLRQNINDRKLTVNFS